MKRRLTWLLGALAPALLLAALPSPTEAKPRKKEKAGEARKHGQCANQKPQSFLVRSTFVVKNHVLPGPHARALNYRIKQYGRVEGHGTSAQNAHLASHYIRPTTFFGLPIQMHERVIPALACVEADLKKSCGQHGYKPQAIGGHRDHNSYRGGEVTNHLFGIAIDIDPERNPCCRCVEPWPDHPACQGDRKTIYERMAMPRCWVETFERHGFHWLGHDRLQDTMHFEFLGKPEKILK
jgi:hypothetical protein